MKSNIVDSLPLNVALLNEEGRIVYANKAWQRFAVENGPFEDVSVGVNYLRVCEAAAASGDEGAAELFDGVRNVASGNLEEFAMEYPSHISDEQRWFRVEVSPLDLKGSRAVVVVHEAITERKRLVDELVSARKAAEAANKAKGQFLANMSHEIRTPLAAILGFAENLCDADLSESERLDSLSFVRRNGEHLLTVINDVLDLAKINAGKMIIECAMCNPCQAILEVADLMKISAEAKGVQLNVEFVGAMPETIQSDSTRIRQILINLIGNAIKFTETGAIRVVTRIVHRKNAPYLQCDVIDTGHGMTDEQAEKLFQPFMQADSATARVHGGTGLGLTISKRFAELLGGDVIVVATRVGVGTTIRVTIATGPLDGVKMNIAQMTATTIEDQEVGVCSDEPSHLSGVRILLAEDNLDIQRLFQYVLEKAGAVVTVVNNGKLAVDFVEDTRGTEDIFDIVLMDMQMPVMDGYEATRQLRDKGYSGHIVALTALANTGDREACIEAGCNDYVLKGVSLRKLIYSVARLVKSTSV